MRNGFPEAAVGVFVFRRITDIDQRLFQKSAVQQRNKEFSVFFGYQSDNRFLGENFTAHSFIFDLDFDFTLASVDQHDFSEF